MSTPAQISARSAQLCTSVIPFGLALVVPSLGALQHSPLGDNGVIAYCAIVFPLLLLAFVYVPRIVADVSEERIRVAGFIFLMLVFVAAAISVPLVNRGVLPGANVRDETLSLAGTELLHGRYPYYVAVTPEEPVTPLPGLLFLSLPFVWLGVVGWQSPIWLFLFYTVLIRFFRSSRAAFSFLVLVFMGAPVIIQELVSGSDLLANTIWITLMVVWIINYQELRGWQRIALALFSGLVFSSRLNFLMITPLLFAAIAQRLGPKEAVKYALLTGSAFVVISVPFYLYDPSGFSPLHVRRFVNRFDTVLPHLDVLILAVSLALAVVLSFRKMDGPRKLLENCAFVLCIPTVAGILLTTIALHKFEVGPYSNFGLSFMFFAALAIWQRSWESNASIRIK